MEPQEMYQGESYYINWNPTECISTYGDGTLSLDSYRGESTLFGPFDYTTKGKVSKDFVTILKVKTDPTRTHSTFHISYIYVRNSAGKEGWILVPEYNKGICMFGKYGWSDRDYTPRYYV